jgi:acetyl esterase/lipase
MVDPESLGDMAELYYTDRDPKTPGISPLFGDLKGFPPLLIQVGDHEVLLDDAVRLAEAAKNQWVVQKLNVFPGAFHVFQAVPGLPESDEALAEIGAFFKKRVVVPKD